MKRRRLFVLVLSLVLVACAACGTDRDSDIFNEIKETPAVSTAPTPSVPVEQKTLVLGLQGAQNEFSVMYNHAQAYMKQNPDVKIIFQALADDITKDSKLSTQLMSGTAPDVLTYFAMGSFQNNGHLVDLTPYIKNDSDFTEKNYDMDLLLSMGSAGRLYSLAYDFSLRHVYAMRKDLDPELAAWFEQADVVTYEDMFELYDKVGRPAELELYAGYGLPSVIESYYPIVLDMENKTCALDGCP